MADGSRYRTYFGRGVGNFCAAAALPRGLVMAIFVTLIATAALVIMFEVAPTGNSSAVVVNHTQ